MAGCPLTWSTKETTGSNAFFLVFQDGRQDFFKKSLDFLVGLAILDELGGGDVDKLLVFFG